MRNKNVDPGGNKYNFTDPLGVIAKEKSIEEKLETPNVVQLFIEQEARKKDIARKFRITPLTQRELVFEFYDVIRKLINMVVVVETKRGYLKGRILSVKGGMLYVCLRGTKECKYIDFNEVIKISNNYA